MTKKKGPTAQAANVEPVEAANPQTTVEETTPTNPSEVVPVPSGENQSQAQIPVPVPEPIVEAVTGNAPASTGDATDDLVSEIVGSKPTPEPEGVASAAQKKKRGRPSNAELEARSGIKTPTKKKVPTWPDGTPIDFEACEIAAEQTTHSSMMVMATVFGDASLIKGQNKEAKEQEEVIVAGWKRYYEKFGIKESDPRLTLLMGYAGLMAVHMQKPKTRKKVIKRVTGVWGQMKLGVAWAKEKFRAMRGE